MARRKIYIVKSGSLHKTENRFWLTPSYHTSREGALHCAKQILDINRATDIVEHPTTGEHDLRMVDYNGEEEKYKGRVIVEWAWLNSY
jgi:hypothetical protein